MYLLLTEQILEKKKLKLRKGRKKTARIHVLPSLSKPI